MEIERFVKCLSKRTICVNQSKTYHLLQIVHLDPIQNLRIYI